ncbi:permease prefix domain 1-containing protein [Micromonospora sp. 4G57]|uniref:Permease prefix domain 1-containing protein n=1 Tax=Micromonospora sicca TaxID=2202420 RepID=A0ABU5J9H7_9ACTN|nr:MULTISPECIES: permease prefix domain 1-containing protein [unclassified Micromonospora]MDZ5441911.1 permease prefix domain 1-containing protein [Micromonospora sp. 4G57]MDZ5489236.1 permease prefix domain 1-containing protein [Micromonospora sp. 4G53]
MRGYDGVLVEERLRELAGRLRGPARLKTDLLTEARHALLDAAEAYRADGLPAAEAERRAVAEFGSPAQLAPGYQAELAAGALRGLAVRALAVAVALMVGGDLTWRGAHWRGGPPPEGYQLLSASLNGIWGTVAGLALAGLLLGFLAARYGSARLPRLGRVVGFGLTGALGVGALAGGALLAWSIGLWQAALTWPPMMVGAVLASAAWFALARAARSWLLAIR